MVAKIISFLRRNSHECVAFIVGFHSLEGPYIFYEVGGLVGFGGVTQKKTALKGGAATKKN